MNLNVKIFSNFCMLPIFFVITFDLWVIFLIVKFDVYLYNNFYFLIFCKLFYWGVDLSKNVLNYLTFLNFTFWHFCVNFWRSYDFLTFLNIQILDFIFFKIDQLLMFLFEWFWTSHFNTILEKLFALENRFRLTRQREKIFYK